MASLAPQAKFKAFVTGTSTPLVGGKLYTYAAGTTTPLATYTNQGGGTANTNPVILNANGEADLWLGSSSYKFVLNDPLDTPISTVDNIQSVDAALAVIATATQNVATVAALRTTVPTYSGQQFNLLGYTVAGKGGGIVYYDATDATTADNGVTVFVSGSYRFKRPALTTLSAAMAGAIEDGATDDTAAIQRAITYCLAYGDVQLSGASIISSSLTVPTDHITIRGPAKLTAKAAVSFQDMMTISGRTGVVVRDLDFDCNKAARSGAQAHRFIGLNFSACTDSSALNVIVQGTRGFGGISAVGMGMAGGSIRGEVNNCRFYNCGDAGFDSDGVFSSGEQNVISNCQAINCTDVGFVIESSNFSVISGCTSMGCAGGAAITNGSAAVKQGNIINGLTVQNWSGASTGGIQIGSPGAFGNLLDTELNGVVMYADTASYGAGAAINIRQLGTGRAIGVTINGVRINGSVNQGILVDGDDVTISGATIKGCDTAIKFQDGTTGGEVIGGKFSGGNYGIYSAGTASVHVSAANFVSQTLYGMYAANTSNITSRLNHITGAGTASYGSDSTAAISANLEKRSVVLVYGVTVSTNAALGNFFTVTPTNGTAFTFAAPTNAVEGMQITYTVINTTGGALGAVTWNAIYKMPVYAAPATGFSRSITFKYNGANWIEINRTPSDVPN